MIRRRWWQESPIHQGEHEVSRKPSRGECRMMRRTCGDYACVLFTFAHKAAGANRAPGIPCALHDPRAFVFKNPGASRGGNAELCLEARAGRAPDAVRAVPRRVRDKVITSFVRRSIGFLPPLRTSNGLSAPLSVLVRRATRPAERRPFRK